MKEKDATVGVFPSAVVEELHTGSPSHHSPTAASEPGVTHVLVQSEYHMIVSCSGWGPGSPEDRSTAGGICQSAYRFSRPVRNLLRHCSFFLNFTEFELLDLSC